MANVFLVGAGPGDPGMLTLRAKEIIESCDIMIYDYLANAEFLKWCKPDLAIRIARSCMWARRAGNTLCPRTRSTA